MTGFPCCCSEQLGGDTFCYTNIVEGIKTFPIGHCECPDCEPLNRTYFTGIKKEDFFGGIGKPPPSFPQGFGNAAVSFLCDSEDKVEKCAFGPNTATFFGKIGNDWFLNFIIGFAKGFGPSTGHNMRWRSDSLGPDLPTGDVTDIVCPFLSTRKLPGWSCDASSSIVTVNRIEPVQPPSTGVPLDCGPSEECTEEQFPSPCIFGECNEANVDRHPNIFTLIFPNDWQVNPCGPFNADNCNDTIGICFPIGNLIAESDDFVGDFDCVHFWEDSLGLTTVRLFISTLPDGFGFAVAVDRLCGYEEPGLPSGRARTSAYRWGVDLGLCSNGVGDCFLGGGDVSIPFFEQGQINEFGVISPYPPGVTPCCVWEEASLILRAS